MALKKEEVYRKVLHLFTGIIFPGLVLYIPRYAPHYSWLPAWLTPKLYPPALALLAAIGFTAFEQARFRLGPAQAFFYRLSGAALRPEEAKKMTGATYIVYAVLACSIVFVNKPFISFMVLCAFIWGDAAAALVGQSIGRNQNRKKIARGILRMFRAVPGPFYARLSPGSACSGRLGRRDAASPGNRGVALHYGHGAFPDKSRWKFYGQRQSYCSGHNGNRHRVFISAAEIGLFICFLQYNTFILKARY